MKSTFDMIYTVKSIVNWPEQNKPQDISQYLPIATWILSYFVNVYTEYHNGDQVADSTFFKVNSHV